MMIQRARFCQVGQVDYEYECRLNDRFLGQGLNRHDPV